jgi:DNA-binding response OmpR family regulator
VQTILVVEDYVPGRRALCACIEDLGYIALQAGTVAEARSIIGDGVVDLVVVDVDRAAHRELVQELRSVPRHPHVLTLSAANADMLPEPDPTMLRMPLTFNGLADAISRVLAAG